MSEADNNIGNSHDATLKELSGNKVLTFEVKDSMKKIAIMSFF